MGEIRSNLFNIYAIIMLGEIILQLDSLLNNG